MSCLKVERWESMRVFDLNKWQTAWWQNGDLVTFMHCHQVTEKCDNSKRWHRITDQKEELLFHVKHFMKWYVYPDFVTEVSWRIELLTAVSVVDNFWQVRYNFFSHGAMTFRVSMQIFSLTTDFVFHGRGSGHTDSRVNCRQAMNAVVWVNAEGLPYWLS